MDASRNSLRTLQTRRRVGSRAPSSSKVMVLAPAVAQPKTGTIDFQSFAETVFEFRVTPALMLQGIVFSVGIGVVGSFLPAVRAADEQTLVVADGFSCRCQISHGAAIISSVR